MSIVKVILRNGKADRDHAPRGGSAGHFISVVLGGILVACLFLMPAAEAGLDRVFFSINGDTTLTAMTQGDELYWGSTCDSGSTINWEIWYDGNSNSIIEPSQDFLLNSENITDGNAVTEPNAVLDGFSLSSPFTLSGEPGPYIFRAKDIVADSSLQKVLTMAAMPSPPNQFTGQITLPGISAPHSQLANVSIFAESESAGGAYFGLTDNMGMYSMNVGAEGSGVAFFLFPSGVSGFVAPPEIMATASGVVTGNDFTYEAAVDSVYGYVKDDLGTVLNFETQVSAESNFAWRSATTSGGRYAIYFSGTDGGEWRLEPDSRLSPLYLTPDQYFFDLDTLTSFEHDIILTRADAMIYARVTEEGGEPLNSYKVWAYSSSQGFGTEAVSGTGSDNIAVLHVSSLDPSDWYLWLNQYDYEFPIPLGMTIESDASGVAPGDTVTLNLIAGKLISGTITQDPEDGPINWGDVWVGADMFGTNADMGGGFAFYTAVGSYYLSIQANGYLTNPQGRQINVVDDITSGLDFVINEAHCRVSGTLTGVTLPLDNPYYSVVARTGTDGSDGYIIYGEVDPATGTYELYVCDGSWTIDPPWVLGAVDLPASAILVIGEAPDTLRTVDFAYTNGSCCEGHVGDVNGEGGDEPTIGDIAILIDVLFISLDWNQIACMTETDVNQSGGTDPVGGEGGDITIGDISILIDALFITNDWTQLPACL